MSVLLCTMVCLRVSVQPQTHAHSHTHRQSHAHTCSSADLRMRLVLYTNICTLSAYIRGHMQQLSVASSRVPILQSQLGEGEKHSPFIKLLRNKKVLNLNTSHIFYPSCPLSLSPPPPSHTLFFSLYLSFSLPFSPLDSLAMSLSLSL